MPVTRPTERARHAVAQLRDRIGQPAVELAASGSAAIEVALELLGVGPGDEVVVPDLGCHNIAAAVLRRCAVPVFVAVGEALTLRPEEAADAVSSRTRAVIAVHQYGLPCDVGGIVALVPPGVTVIEDMAQTWGSHSRGVPCGAAGGLTVTSFGPGKPVCLGAGGALFGPAATVVGAISRGDARESHLLHPPSTARFPAPLLEELPAAIERADAGLVARRAAVEAFLADELSTHFRLPPSPPDSCASWTTVPLYPTGAVSAAILRALRQTLGPIELMPPVPPSQLPMFADVDKRVVPGHRRPHPLLVTLAADGFTDHG